MKGLFVLALLSFNLSSFAQEPGAVYSKVPVTEVFAPKGFDSNDNVEIVISGFLPNLCYKSPAANVEIKGKDIYIEMKALRIADLSSYCAEMVVPYLEAVDVGLLDRGQYQVHVAGQPAASLFVAESSSDAMDELVYANIDHIEKGLDSNVVKLKGYNPSDCFVFDRVENVDNGINAFSVMPIMKQVSEFCPRKMVPFEIEWKIPARLDREQVLLHVRSMNGKSVNSLINLQSR